MLNVVIIDDDSVSREIIRSYINFTDDLQLVKEFSNPEQALKEIENVDCDLIFLDIEMPEMTGLDFIEAAKKIPQVIIVSSNPSYAAESYNYDVTDYLVKPVEYSRFLKGLNRVKAISDSISLRSPETDKHLFIKSGNEHVKLNFSSINYIEAFADYVQIYTDDKRYTVLSTMKSIQTKLGEEDFLRVHRSYIISLNKVDVLNGDGVVVGGKQIRVSRNYKKVLKERLKK